MKTFFDMLLDDSDRQKIQDAAVKVSESVVKQLSEILVPAIATAAKGVMGDVTLKVGPITIEPIKISVEVGVKEQ